MKRCAYNALRDWQKTANRKPLIVQGARQVGKTHLLKQFGKENFKKLHYFNFEREKNIHSIFKKDVVPDRVLRELSFHLNDSIALSEDLLFFDEIQECPEALTSLKYFSEEKKELAICAAGSLLGVHLGCVSFPVGKVSFLNLFPMSFMEFLEGVHDAKSLEVLQNIFTTKEISEIAHAHLWEQLKAYFVVGGLPEVITTYRQHGSSLLAYNEVRKKQEELILSYQADMAKHSGKINSMHIERVWRNVAAQLGSTIDGSAPKYRFQGVLPQGHGFRQLSGPIDWLGKAGIAINVKIAQKARLPLHSFVKENFFKLFSFDVGILGALCDLSPTILSQFDFGTYKGFFAENFVAQELLANVGRPLYSWREASAEVEFLYVDDAQIVPIEVKSGHVTKAKSLRAFSEKYHPKRSVILSGKNMEFKHPLLRLPLYLAGRIKHIMETEV